MKQLLFIILFFNLFLNASAQDKYVTLKQEKISTIPADYHVSGVMDDRDNKDAIGNISYGDGQKGNIILQGGTNSIMTFIEKNVTQNISTKPVFLHINQLNAVVKKEGSQWDINMESSVTFYASGYKLVEYSGNANAQTNESPEIYIDAMIRKAIQEDLEDFNKWWPANRDQISTSPDVQVNVVVSKTPDKPGAIIYSVNRPLQIADFTGPVQATGYEMAATASGIFMTIAEKVEKGEMIIDVVISPYFDTRTSWFKEEGKIPAVLAHEQAHFDITAIKACELAKTIRNTKFTKEDYANLLEKLRQENADASREEENTYDTETNHGIIKDKQLEWQNKLTQQVRTIGCY